MIVLIDNYDSFSYNVVQQIGSLVKDEEIKVFRNDAITPEEVLAMKPSHIILSPGPGRPCEAGICEDLIRLDKGIPLLGICLGHQAIGEVMGMKVNYAKNLMHGKKSIVDVDTESVLFKGMDKKQEVARYHSLVVEDNEESDMKVVARADNGEIMAIEHKTLPIYGLQFHPESVLTANGNEIMKRFLGL